MFNLEIDGSVWSASAPAALTTGKNRGIHRTGGWPGPRVDMDAVDHTNILSMCGI